MTINFFKLSKDYYAEIFIEDNQDLESNNSNEIFSEDDNNVTNNGDLECPICLLEILIN